MRESIHFPQFRPHTSLAWHNPAGFPGNNPARLTPYRLCPTKSRSWRRCSSTKHRYNRYGQTSGYGRLSRSLLCRLCL
jgi:hypothetical protein